MQESPLASFRVFLQRSTLLGDSSPRRNHPRRARRTRAHAARATRRQRSCPRRRRRSCADTRPQLNTAQHGAIEQVLSSRDQVQGFARAFAGTGKTTTLEAIRYGAEQNGYAVEGFAPTSQAARQLREAGVPADTLQGFLARCGQPIRQLADPSNKHLYMVDESSLASTKTDADFLSKINPQDKVLLVGDTRQHQGVDAGKPFEDLQQAGMRTARLDQIIRQRTLSCCGQWNTYQRTKRPPA